LPQAARRADARRGPRELPGAVALAHAAAEAPLPRSRDLAPLLHRGRDPLLPRERRAQAGHDRTPGPRLRRGGGPRMSVWNALTIDVEDWFHIMDVGGPGLDQWGSLESRVEKNTDSLLALLDEHKVTATFFVLGWIAERYP